LTDRALWIAERASEFDGAICIDAMENVFPEDWPRVLANLKHAVRPGSPVYLTVELTEDDLADRHSRPDQSDLNLSCARH